MEQILCMETHHIICYLENYLLRKTTQEYLFRGYQSTALFEKIDTAKEKFYPINAL